MGTKKPQTIAAVSYISVPHHTPCEDSATPCSLAVIHRPCTVTVPHLSVTAPARAAVGAATQASANIPFSNAS
ncbi:hypothetical protein GJB61_28985 [Paenibacillus sp. LC-T2]|uniref:Uncharacterized protein n=1 Tax=Paenibacillus monticola TaxID=2666075 RepID=A0A7X2HBJ7_9BACL|nr:hypothetical protein [Paenibacillus monticola]